ncbi:hypothetical protein [Aliarcobacter cryaerophilus]|uniref:hypothetical protein n=1 Tax=Aliarcobacter cryaerophilus TaxID=28198 RepID=UPI000825EED4|nr:hypothetical protein [Aliarcobacter cryaerophilus]
MKFERPNSNIVPFGTNANENKRFAFGTNNYTNDINENLNDSFKLGWETVGINSKPPRQWFNGLAYTSTYLTSYLFQTGIPEWNDKQKYYINSIAMGSDGNIYRSLVGTEETPNVNNNPTLAGSTSWKTILSDYALINGDETKRFKVADAVELNEAVNKKQLNEASMKINILNDKATPVDTDNFAIQEIGGLFKKLNWSNIKESLKSIFLTKPELVTITGTATFDGSTQKITMTGVGTITLALGDVIEVTGTANNNKLFTVESLVDDNNIIVNYEHRNTNPATFGKLINETATNCTIKLYNRAKNALLGQGQYPVNVSRTANQGYKSQPNRAIEVVSSFSNGRNIQMSSNATDWLTLSGNSEAATAYWSIIVPPNFYWKTNSGVTYTTTEVR